MRWPACPRLYSTERLVRWSRRVTSTGWLSAWSISSGTNADAERLENRPGSAASPTSRSTRSPPNTFPSTSRWWAHEKTSAAPDQRTRPRGGRATPRERRSLHRRIEIHLRGGLPLAAEGRAGWGARAGRSSSPLPRWGSGGWMDRTVAIAGQGVERRPRPRPFSLRGDRGAPRLAQKRRSPPRLHGAQPLGSLPPGDLLGQCPHLPPQRPCVHGLRQRA